MTLFKKRFLKSLKQVDIFGKPVQLLIKQQETHKTLFGSFLTVGLITLFVYFLAQNLLKLTSKSNPSSYQSEVYHAEPEYYELHPENFTLTFSIENPDFLTYIDKSIYVVEAILSTKTIQNINGTDQIVWGSEEIPITQCSKSLIKQTELQTYFSNLDLSTNYCINWDKIDKISLKGNFDSESFHFITIKFYMCTDQTQQGTECKQKEEIQQALKNNFFSLQMSSYVVDIQDSENPFHSRGEDSFTTISSKILKEISYYLQPITMLTDFGTITQDIETKKTLRYGRQTEMIDLNDGDLLMNVNIRLDTTEIQFRRSYPKLQTILGELGGLWQVMFTVALLIQQPINMLSYYLRIINSLFEFQQEEINNKKSNNNELKSEEINSDLKSCNNRPSAQSQILSKEPLQSLSEFNTLNSKTHRRLKSIVIKNEVIKKLNEDNNYQSNEQVIKVTKDISKSIKEYFQSVQRKLQLKWIDYVYFMKCFVNSNNFKSLQIEYAVSKVSKQIDLLYIIKKLQEIDKLKMIFLTESQTKLFDYIHKPTIPQNPYKDGNQAFSYYSILKPVKNDHQKALDAQIAFKELVENLQDPINNKLIQQIDQKIINLLSIYQTKDHQQNILISQVQIQDMQENKENKKAVINFDDNSFKMNE